VWVGADQLNASHPGYSAYLQEVTHGSMQQAIPDFKTKGPRASIKFTIDNPELICFIDNRFVDY
jgi:hypothetical protein